MATPLSADRLLTALRAEGMVVRERSGWRTHNRNHKGRWGGVNGVVIHHTAGADSLDLCWSGTASLPGPLCHTHLSKSGVATMVGHGRANHAGTFAQNAHDAVVRESSTHPRPDASEPVDGNAHYYGIEIENRGNGDDPYPRAQYDQAVRWAAAICRAHGWSAQSVIGHKEGTRRKIDPSFSMATFRRNVAERLEHGPEWGGGVEDEMPQYVSLTRPGAVELEPGRADAVEFTTEYGDDRDDHYMPGGSQFVRGPALYTGTAYLSITDVDAGADIQVEVAEVDHDSGDYVSRSGWGEYVGTGGSTFIAFPFTESVGAGRGVRLRIKHFSSGPVTVEHVTLKALVWER